MHDLSIYKCLPEDAPIEESKKRANDILENLTEWLEEYAADFITESDETPNMYFTKCTQNQWTAALMSVGRKMIRPYHDNCLFIRVPGNTAYQYNYALLMLLQEDYVARCMQYDKEASVYGFCHLYCIDVAVIYKAMQRARVQDSDVYRFFKTLLDANEESLSGIIITGKRNPVGALAALNKRHNWSMPGVNQPTQIQAEEAPEVIAARYREQLATDTPPEAPED